MFLSANSDHAQLLHPLILPLLHPRLAQGTFPSIQKHQVCPTCRQVPSVIRLSGKTFTIKKKRVATWKPQSQAPEISITFKGMHH
jgi:hypothetical protein